MRYCSPSRSVLILPKSTEWHTVGERMNSDLQDFMMDAFPEKKEYISKFVSQFIDV